jgi:hypothetical protein
MKYLVLLMLVSGCVTPPYVLQPMGGDRSGGTVELGAFNVRHSQPNLNMPANQTIADNQCKQWGYDYAVPFAGMESNCSNFNGFRCFRFNVKVKYHCEYNKKD